MLYAPYTPPQPFADADEQRVRATLSAIDPLLDIRWFQHAIFNEREGLLEGRYALVCRWAPGDPRFELIHKGEMGEHDAIDIIGWFCEDRQDADSVPVDVDAIENLALELLGSCDNSRTPALDRMRQIAVKNVTKKRQRRDEVLEVAQEEAEGVWFRKTPKIFVPSIYESERN